MWRGLNLGGSNKNPSAPRLPTYEPYRFYETKQISFVDRPFPLQEAEEHFTRIKSWGYNLIRLVVTWEAIEHKAPGVYDQAYLDYIQALVRKAEEFELFVLIDIHQDVWSRFSGGDGAPLWTFEKAGLDAKQFHQTGMAVLHQMEGDRFQDMIWVTNYAKLACATMFTLFFGGNDFAPLVKVEGRSIQDYLQQHYLNAIRQLVIHLKDLSNVIGYEVMNEPSPGWIGWQDLNSNDFIMKKGACPSPFESMCLASGYFCEVENWTLTFRGPKLKGKTNPNERGIRVWSNRQKCIWQRHGVWELDAKGNPVVSQPTYFSEREGRKVHFSQDYLLPFIKKYATMVHQIQPEALIFVEYPMGQPPPKINEGEVKNLVSAPHWYDGVTLVLKKYRSWLSYDTENHKLVRGKKNVRKLFSNQLAILKSHSEQSLGKVPTIIGEIGIPFDMHGKKAYRTGNFRRQNLALNASFKAIEANMLSVVVWNYTTDNTNENGDGWNKEDLSVFSRDQQIDKHDIYSGGRALKALIRPYPMKIAGHPLHLSFDISKCIFEFEFEHEDDLKQVSTELFIPNYQYPNGYKVVISDGDYEKDEANQLLIYHHSAERFTHLIKILKT